MNIVSLLTGLVLFFLTANTIAGEKQLRESLQVVFPGINITQVNQTPVNGIYEVMVGAEVMYVTGDGSFVFKGDLINIRERRNLSEDVRKQARSDLLQEISMDQYIEFPARNTENIIYIFTDVDCGYCRKLHMDVPKLNKNGVTVRYLAYPRAGLESPTAKTMVNIWCAKDRAVALTDAKRGIFIEDNDCNNPVASHYALGGELGVRGTPAIFLSDGLALPGYVPPDELLTILAR